MVMMYCSFIIYVLICMHNFQNPMQPISLSIYFNLMDTMEDFIYGSRPRAKLLEDIESEKKVQSLIIKTSTQEVSDSTKLVNVSQRQ